MDSRKESSSKPTNGGKPRAGTPKGSNSGASKHAPNGVHSNGASSKRAPNSAPAPGPKAVLGPSAEALAAIIPARVVDLSNQSMNTPKKRPARSVRKGNVTGDRLEYERSFQPSEVAYITGDSYAKYFSLVQTALGGRGVQFYFIGDTPEDKKFDKLIENAGAPTGEVDGVIVHYLCKHPLAHCKSSLPGKAFKSHVDSGCCHITLPEGTRAKRLNPAFKVCVCLDENCSGQDHGIPCTNYPYAFHPVDGLDHFGVKVTQGMLVCSCPCCPGSCDKAHAPPKDVAAFAAKLAQLNIKPANSAENGALTACAAAIKAVGPSRLKDLTQLLTEVAANVMALVNALKPADLALVAQALDPVAPKDTEAPEDPNASVAPEASEAVARVMDAVNDLPAKERVEVVKQIRTYAEAVTRAAALPTPMPSNVSTQSRPGKARGGPKAASVPTPVAAPVNAPVAAPVNAPVNATYASTVAKWHEEPL